MSLTSVFTVYKWPQRDFKTYKSEEIAPANPKSPKADVAVDDDFDNGDDGGSASQANLIIRKVVPNWRQLISRPIIRSNLPASSNPAHIWHNNVTKYFLRYKAEKPNISKNTRLKGQIFCGIQCWKAKYVQEYKAERPNISWNTRLEGKKFSSEFLTVFIYRQ